MVTRRETQDMGNTGYSPLPNGASRTVHHPTGRGDGHSGGLKGHGDRTGGLQGGAHSGTHSGSVSSGGHGESASEAAAPASPAGALLPPKKFPWGK